VDYKHGTNLLSLLQIQVSRLPDAVNIEAEQEKHQQQCEPVKPTTAPLAIYNSCTYLVYCFYLCPNCIIIIIIIITIIQLDAMTVTYGNLIQLQ